MLVDNSILQYVATDVLNGMLGLNVSPATRLQEVGDDMFAVIRITGDWQAGLEIATTFEGAGSIARQFFGNSVEELSRCDISDALGEVANMIGGNIKGLCWGETRLSIPVVSTIRQRLDPSSTQDAVKAHLKFGSNILSILIHRGEHASTAKSLAQ